MKKREGCRIVDRPLRTKGRSQKYPYALILKASKRGKAVEIPLNGTSGQQAYFSIYQGLKRVGFKMRGAIKKDRVVVWAEKA